MWLEHHLVADPYALTTAERCPSRQAMRKTCTIVLVICLADEIRNV